MNFSMDNRIAKIVGADSAIILHNILFWVKRNKANRKNFHEGKTWTYNTIKAFSEIFDWLTERQIRTCLEKLEKEGLVETGVFNKLGYDRTKWYTATQKAYDILGEVNCQNGTSELTKMSNRKDGNVSPIPDINTDINTDTQQPLIPSLSSKLITKETSNNNDSLFKTEETNKAIETKIESSKTKETNKKKEKANALPTANESFYKNIESIYFENYKTLFEKGMLQIEVPAYSYAKNRAILSRYKNYDESLLKKVLDNAKDDKWIVDNGYGFNQIFSENVFNRLVNIKSKDDLIPVQNNCAKCGFPLQNNKCLFCG